VIAILVLVVAISIAMEDGVEDDVEVGRRGGRRFLSGRFGRLRFGRRAANRAGNDELDLGEEEGLSTFDTNEASEERGGGLVSMSSYVTELQKAQDKCPNDSLVCPSSAATSSAKAATSSLIAPSKKSARGTPDNDPGKAARCKQVISGSELNAGTLDCRVAKNRCWLPNEMKLKTGYSRCKRKFKYGCKDGIDEHGVFMFDDVEGDGNGYCSSWMGMGVVDGVVTCNKDHSICNKAKLDRDNVKQSKGVLVFMQKRVSCNPEGRCDVFKVGLCIDTKKYIMLGGQPRTQTNRWEARMARAAKNAIKKGMFRSTSQKYQCAGKDLKVAQSMIDLF